MQYDLAEDYKKRFELDAMFTEQMIKHMLNGIHKDSVDLIDVGCSQGLLQKILQGTNQEVRYTGVDKDPNIIALAQSVQTGKSHFYVGDCDELPFENESFDLYFSRMLYDSQERVSERSIDEMLRVLRDGGGFGLYFNNSVVPLCYPKPRHWEKFRRACTFIEELHGARFYQAYRYLLDRNVSSLDVHYVKKDSKIPGREALRKYYIETNVELQHDILVRSKLMTEKQLLEYTQDMEKLLFDDNSYIVYFQIQLIGKK